MQGRGQANGGAPHMRQYPHPIGAGHSLHLKAFGKAPGDADIRLHYIQTALLNRIAKSPTPLQLLAASDPHRQFLPKLPITLNLIWGHRLLIPVEVLVANPIADIKRSTHIIGAIRIDSEERLTTDRLAHRANQVQRVVERGAKRFLANYVKSAGDEAERNMTWSEYRSTAKRLLSNKLVLGIAAVGALRQAVHVSFFAFLVLYMTEELDYSPFVVGLHLALLTAAGIVSTPVMGIISDRYGRKPVIVVAMSLMALFIFLFLIFDSGLPLTAVIGILGLFFLSSLSIINAAAIDQVDKGSEGSGMALLFAGGAVVGAIAPIVAGFIYADEGFRGFVWFAGSLATAGAVLAALLPMKRPIRN